MRIITGTARGKNLITLEGEDVRPTTERVKEALFSIIQFDVPGSKVLDAFAGSGQLGIEAISRGATSCTFVDSSKKAHDVQKENLKNAGLNSSSRVILSDSISFLSSCKDKYDIVFLDPPYHNDVLDTALEKVVPLISDTGIVICEHDRKKKMPEAFGDLELQKQYKYGKIMLSTYKLKEETV